MLLPKSIVGDASVLFNQVYVVFSPTVAPKTLFDRDTNREMRNTHTKVRRSCDALLSSAHSVISNIYSPRNCAPLTILSTPPGMPKGFPFFPFLIDDAKVEERQEINGATETAANANGTDRGGA